MSMGKPEAHVEDYLRKKVREAGCLCYKFISPGIKGVPDDIILHHGRVTFIETKSQTGLPSKIQNKRIAEMREQGADVRICSTREDVDVFLQECKLDKSEKPK